MKKIALVLLGGIFLLDACSNKNSNEASTEMDTTEVVVPGADKTASATPVRDSVTLTAFTGSPDFPDAALELNKPQQNEVLKTNDVVFNYELKNYTLGVQTPDADHKHCSNSTKGQHIHLILNNEPYIAHYETTFKETLKDGHYVALSFLSRSYHESLKHFGAFDLRQFTVGKAESKKVDLTKPLLFYSRPKGEYVGEDTKKVLLDFYLVNTDLAKDGNKVKATINGKEFTLDKWQPYSIEGLPMGENTIALELVDKDGKYIEGPYNKVERKITLKEKEATQ